jgi:hypothetical protein
MEYILEIEIAPARARVVELFNDPDKLHGWRAGRGGREQLIGTAPPGRVTRGGARRP